ncbi:hypothetical protein N7456_007525 [Penicillium angulare]|uniref:Uncharacterized protein n=1 Tax=Penicillium angulare TaxID=116970 RepID=A0A9W9FAV2_9EURO|nr:hypothetical protein N7456_007525 [Penicillium angulare]
MGDCMVLLGEFQEECLGAGADLDLVDPAMEDCMAPLEGCLDFLVEGVLAPVDLAAMEDHTPLEAVGLVGLVDTGVLGGLVDLEALDILDDLGEAMDEDYEDDEDDLDKDPYLDLDVDVDMDNGTHLLVKHSLLYRHSDHNIGI